jgi:hypothetical protein
MKQKPTMKQRLAIIGQLGFLMGVENKAAYMGVPESFIKEYDCSGHFYSSDDVEELMAKARQYMESDFEAFSRTISLIIFILSDTSNI